MRSNGGGGSSPTRHHERSPRRTVFTRLASGRGSNPVGEASKNANAAFSLSSVFPVHGSLTILSSGNRPLGETSEGSDISCDSRRSCDPPLTSPPPRELPPSPIE